MFTLTLTGQKREHLIGIRAAYNISGMDTRPDINSSSIKTYNNYSLVYTFYHDLWDMIHNFGFQAGISRLEQGYFLNEQTVRYEVITVPLVSQFHLDFWRMRLLLNAGGFGGYRLNKIDFDGTEGFDQHDIRYDYGFIAGAGVAFIFKPFELHLEGNYQYSLSYYHKPQKYSNIDYLFTYPHQLLFSVTLNFHIK